MSHFHPLSTENSQARSLSAVAEAKAAKEAKEAMEADVTNDPMIHVLHNNKIDSATDFGTNQKNWEFGASFFVLTVGVSCWGGQVFGTTHNICEESLQITKEELRRRIGQAIHTRFFRLTHVPFLFYLVL